MSSLAFPPLSPPVSTMAKSRTHVDHHFVPSAVGKSPRLQAGAAAFGFT